MRRCCFQSIFPRRRQFAISKSKKNCFHLYMSRYLGYIVFVFYFFQTMLILCKKDPSTHLFTDFRNSVKYELNYIVHSRTISIALLAKWYQYRVKITNFICVCMYTIHWLMHSIVFVYSFRIGMCACSQYCAHEHLKKKKRETKEKSENRSETKYSVIHTKQPHTHRHTSTR